MADPGFVIAGYLLTALSLAAYAGLLLRRAARASRNVDPRGRGRR